MEIGLTWRNKTVFNQEIDIQKTLVKGLQVAGLVAVGTIIYSNTSSAITTAFADQLPEGIRPDFSSQIIKEIVDLVENPMSIYTNMSNDLNFIMDTFSKFVHSVGAF